MIALKGDFIEKSEKCLDHISVKDLQFMSFCELNKFLLFLENRFNFLKNLANSIVIKKYFNLSTRAQHPTQEENHKQQKYAHGAQNISFNPLNK